MNKAEVFQSFFNKQKISDLEINNISINSKELDKNDIFVAIRGGNNFVNEALEKGAFAVYDSKTLKIDEKYANRAFFVNDSVEFLQNFAREWRKNLDIKVIGITGSNGKTTVKDMIYHLLSQKRLKGITIIILDCPSLCCVLKKMTNLLFWKWE